MTQLPGLSRDEQFPRRPAAAPVRLRPASRGRARTSAHSLLDLDPDLADELDVEARRLARAAAATATVRAEPGLLPVAEWLEATWGGPGLLVVEGVLVLGVRVGDRMTAELLGAGDLLVHTSRGTETLLSCEITARALLPVHLALLDAAFAKRVRFWPQLTQALMCRGGGRALSLDVQRAIAMQPRLEVRLALLLWHLASRWGKVEPGGIRLPLPLTHQLLGQLVGAERPSVSHALARLAAMDLVTGHGDEWHLHGSLEDQLPTMIEVASTRAEQIVATVAARRSA